MVELSKCQCPAPGLCPVFKRYMGTNPPDWEWCNKASVEDKRAFFNIVSKSTPNYSGLPFEKINFSDCSCAEPGFCPVFNKNTDKDGTWNWCQKTKKESRMSYYQEIKRPKSGFRNCLSRGRVDPVELQDVIDSPKSRYAVCVIPATNSALRLLDITRPSIIAYSEKCGADYIELTGDQSPDWPMANKYRLYHVSRMYEKTLYLDCDVLIKDCSPNIFEITPNDKISASSDFTRFKKWGDTKWIEEEQDLIVHKVLNGNHKNIENGKFKSSQMINGGVLVIPRELSNYYKQPTKPYPRRWCFDQNHLTLILPEDKLNILPVAYNNTTVASNFCVDSPICSEFWSEIDSCYFIHANGIKNHNLREDLLRRFAGGDYSSNMTEITPGTFITNEMIITDTIKMVPKLPPIAGVLGVPRSGMIPASILSTVMSVPLYSLSEGNMVILSEKTTMGGSRMANYSSRDNNLPILVIDDTSYTGAAINSVRRLLKSKYPDKSFLYTVVYHEPTGAYLSQDGDPLLDILNIPLQFPHILEWNFFNAHPTMFGMFDMDGVFCPDCTAEIDADEAAYISWMKNVEPIKDRITKLFPCMAICTGRLEKYRKYTEDWLNEHGIKYNALIMYPGSKKERDSGLGHAHNVAQFKRHNFENYRGKISGLSRSAYYGEAKYFIESCPYQSSLIAKSSKKFRWVVSINEKKTLTCGQV